VRTRTLLLLAIGCGLIILVAGVVQLMRIAAQDEPERPAAVGEPVAIGDLTVTVDGLEEADDRAVVVLEVGGVEDADGTDEFRLVVPDAVLQPTGAGSPELPPCVGTTVERRRCTLTFDLSTVEGSSRVLLYRRGDEQVRWDLTS
jgi:hypothetical protein